MLIFECAGLLVNGYIVQTIKMLDGAIFVSSTVDGADTLASGTSASSAKAKILRSALNTAKKKSSKFWA